MFGELYTIHMAIDTKMGQYSTSQIPVETELGYSPKYTEHILNVIWLNLPRHSLGHELTCSNLWLSQIVTVQNTTSQIDVNNARWCTPKYRKQAHIYSRPFQESFLGTSFMVIITDIHTKRCTSEISPESANMKLFIFMSKVNMGTLPSTFSVLLESISRPWSQVATNHKLRR